MDCLVNLLGTEFDKVQEFTEKYQDDGIIWFLESCDLNVMSIRRAVWQMKHAGWFSHVKGFLIGRPAVFGHNFRLPDNFCQNGTGLLRSHIFAVPILKIGVALYPCILLLERQGYSTKMQKFYYSSTKN